MPKNGLLPGDQEIVAAENAPPPTMAQAVREMTSGVDDEQRHQRHAAVVSMGTQLLNRGGSGRWVPRRPCPVAVADVVASTTGNYQSMFRICHNAFIRHSGVPKRIAISPFRFKVIQWQYFSYIFYKFDEDRFSNTIHFEGNDCTFLHETAKNRHIPPNISATTGPVVTKFSALVFTYRLRKL